MTPPAVKLSTMTAIVEADLKLSLSEDVLAQGRFRDGMEFRVIMKPSGAMILRPKLQGFGCLRDSISMSEGFDEPLEDFKDYTP